MFTPDFRIGTTESGILEVAGELDSGTCQQLLDHFERLVAGASTRQLTLDLRRVSFIDSAGIRALILIQRAASQGALSLAVLPPPSPVLELLKLTGVAERLMLAPDPKDFQSDREPLERSELSLPRRPDSPAQARARIRRITQEQLEDAVHHVAILLTSELVTNAVIHPDPREGDLIGLEITVFESRIRVAVSDSGAGFDPARRRPPHEAGGRGLFLVDAMATRWGTRRSDPDGRFTVWFELDTAAESSQEVARGPLRKAGERS
jgi:anti-anti-sigma factor